MIRFIRTCAWLAGLIFFVSVFTVTGFAQTLEKLSIDSGWQFRQYAANDSGKVALWQSVRTATVPGDVHLDSAAQQADWRSVLPHE